MAASPCPCRLVEQLAEPLSADGLVQLLLQQLFCLAGAGMQRLLRALGQLYILVQFGQLLSQFHNLPRCPLCSLHCLHITSSSQQQQQQPTAMNSINE